MSYGHPEFFGELENPEKVTFILHADMVCKFQFVSEVTWVSLMFIFTFTLKVGTVILRGEGTRTLDAMPCHRWNDLCIKMGTAVTCFAVVDFIEIVED